MNYQLIANSEVVKKIVGDEVVYVPNDPANSNWQEYQAWLAENNEPLPAE